MKIDNNKLKARRESYGWTVAHAAERIGVGVRSVQRWEAGHAGPASDAVIERIAQVYQCSTADICEVGHA